MTEQNLENILNLALDATEEEREKSLNLDVGYNPISREWELIVKYSGSLEAARQIAVQVTELRNEYAIMVVRESDIQRLADLPQIEYIEKPKRLFFQVENGRRVSCIDSVQDTRFAVPGRASGSEGLFGKGVLVAILDSGIDYANRDFRNPDDTTRIVSIWDQTIQGAPPRGYSQGTEYTREQINEALRQNSFLEMQRMIPVTDTSGHGTAVAGIAAGNGLGGDIRNRGVASESDLIVVKLGRPREEGFPRTTELMMGLNYVVEKALELGQPVAVNISFGNTYGSHDGTSLLERFIDDISNMWKSSICIGSGNEATSAGHTSGILVSGQEKIIELAVQNLQTSFSIQIWKEYIDTVGISIVTPSGVRVGPIEEILGPQRFTVGQTDILLYYGEPSPYSTAQEIYIDLLPRETYVTGGIWQIILTPGKVVSGRYELWLPSEGALNRGTGFLFPTEDTTLTIPSTASRVITVGAYDALTFAYADFSGRGPIRGITSDQSGLFAKPDLVAPGVNVTTTMVGGGYAPVSGTSFATPFVTGSAALLMEWGVIRGNDPFLYGEKVKAYLRRGARPLPGFTEYPNPQVGYGALCVSDSLPK